MKILCVHAHPDDFEFYASGTFEMWRRKLGDDLRARLVVCTDGAAGHQALSREETARVRRAEQEASARVGRVEWEMLRLPDGSIPREGLQLDTRLLAALWRAIRDFEPDYLFAPPIATDPLAGIHNDHQTVAEAVRRVAYLINVPHAFTPEYPELDSNDPPPCRVPVILSIYDTYMPGANAYDLAVDVEDAFDRIAEMGWCHRSQVVEWLPWVGRHQMTPPGSPAEWRAMLRARLERRNRELGIDPSRIAEVFSVTAWGEVPDPDQLLADLPALLPGTGDLARLRARLARARG